MKNGKKTYDYFSKTNDECIQIEQRGKKFCVCENNSIVSEGISLKKALILSINLCKEQNKKED